MQTDDTVDLRDWIDLLRRRRGVFLAAAGALFMASLAVAVTWPATYRSQATILIEQQDVPSDLVRSAVASSAAERIESISQQITTRANLLGIAEKFGLFAEAREEQRVGQALDGMRRRIKVETVDVDVVDPRSGRPGRAAIAFTIAYRGGDAETTQQVTQELATLFLDQNRRSRSESANEAFAFLAAEAELLSTQILDLETQIAAFKEQNVTGLPELSEANLRLLENAERQLANVDGQIRALEERRHILEGDLAQISPWRPMMSATGEPVLDPFVLLRSKRAELLALSARYTDRHPDVVRLRREIDGLEASIGPGAPSQPGEGAEIAGVLGMEPDNPAYVSLRARLAAVDGELASLAEYRQHLIDRQADYERRITAGPGIERDYLALSREYEAAVQRYREIRESQNEARVRLNLEAEHGEQFSLIDPPQVPEAPIRPNRPLIAMLGLMMSLAGGLGAAFVAEGLDGRAAEPESGVKAEPTLTELRREVAGPKGDSQVIRAAGSAKPRQRGRRA